MENIIAALDIGTTKVCVLIAQKKEDKLEIIGVGQAPSHGLKKGVVVNIEATTEAIRRAREEAELMAGVQINDIWVGVAGSHIRSFDSKGMVALKDNEVKKEDINRVIDAAKAVNVPLDRDVLHVIPREYQLDDQDGIYDPIGMSGIRLEASIHIITGSKSALQNIIKCTQKANLKVSGLVLQQLASSYAILSEDERKLGVALVDMGGGTSDLVIYINGSVAYTASLPIGGSHVTNDIAVGLRTPQVNAEDLKKKYGCALASLVDSQEMVEVEGVGGRKSRSVLRQHLCEVIEPRVEETLNFINNEIQKSGLAELLGSGLVLTGGGSQLEGLIELGEFMLDLPVRKGVPEKIGGITSAVQAGQYATGVGILMYGSQNQVVNTKMKPDFQAVKGIVNKVKGYLDNIF